MIVYAAQPRQHVVSNRSDSHRKRTITRRDLKSSEATKCVAFSRSHVLSTSFGPSRLPDNEQGSTACQFSPIRSHPTQGLRERDAFLHCSGVHLRPPILDSPVHQSLLLLRTSRVPQQGETVVGTPIGLLENSASLIYARQGGTLIWNLLGPTHIESLLDVSPKVLYR